MDSVAYTNDAETMKTPRTRRIAKVSASKAAKVAKTPESELMTVEEYFGILRKRVNDYYDNL
jgi:ABC-type sulfate transport system substrate-binding protein